jgi:hypothetical protein
MISAIVKKYGIEYVITKGKTVITIGRGTLNNNPDECDCKKFPEFLCDKYYIKYDNVWYLCKKNLDEYELSCLMRNNYSEEILLNKVLELI